TAGPMCTATSSSPTTSPWRRVPLTGHSCSTATRSTTSSASATRRSGSCCCCAVTSGSCSTIARVRCWCGTQPGSRRFRRSTDRGEAGRDTAAGLSLVCCRRLRLAAAGNDGRVVLVGDRKIGIDGQGLGERLLPLDDGRIDVPCVEELAPATPPRPGAGHLPVEPPPLEVETA